MMMTTSLVSTINHAMEPLTKRFGLLVREESESAMTAEVLYANDVTAMRVTIEWLEYRPFVTLYQLEGGHLPLKTAVALAMHEKVKAFDADILLKLRMEGASPVGKMFSAWNPDAALSLLSEYAVALGQHADDVLSGDFEIFSTLEDILRRQFDALRE
ncbi:MAG: hypothetical protein ACREN6_02645 [Gemmatimonadaceae bacterium]